jgi:RNA polymerase sigma factor (TIGR02999 family)
MADITELLELSAGGDRAAINAVFERVYPELRRLAQSQLGRGEHTLTPTALVHETYLRLFGASALTLQSRRHFFACAARAMRNILIDHLRAGGADKRGGGAIHVTLDNLEVLGSAPATQLLDLDQALDALEQIGPRLREIVELRFFAGLEFAEIAELLECSERTVFRGWQRGRAWLHARLGTDTA